MDSRARLDHAVFHLTPTRTRCDLVAFCGKSSEKLASGLLEPFVSHLKVAKDEILKGGYSITLCPPSHLDSHWFTKATFQRFVRFVSTPEILERFVSIEMEIQQIESSIQSNESPPDSSKVKLEANATEENSKARLQRVLGSRQAILRREQAMAYQRALVLGFDLASIDDLLVFAGCFGASRLHEACVKFRELCVMKHNDSVWMDELAAVKAFVPPEHGYVETPAVVLTSEVEPNETDNKSQLSSEKNGGGSMPQPGQYPPFMYNFKNSMQQGQLPFPMYPPYYPPNMQWSSNMDQPVGHHFRSGKSASRKKGRSSDGTSSEEDSQSESSDSASDSDFDEYKQNGRNHSSGEFGRKKKHKKKKPSKTVVIRNINYITSKHGEEEEEEEEVAVYDLDYDPQGGEKSGRKNGDLEKKGNVSGGNRSTETWDNFQNLLMRDKDSDTDFAVKQDFSPYVDNSEVGMRGEKLRVQQPSPPSDSLLPSNEFIDNGNGMSLAELENNTSFRPAIRRGDLGGEDLIFSHGHFAELNGNNGVPSDFATESGLNKIAKSSDWSIADQSGLLKNQNGTAENKWFNGSYELSPAGIPNGPGSGKESFIDDSIAVQSHSATNTQEDSRWRTDINMVLDQTATNAEKSSSDPSEDKLAKRLSYEPDEVFYMPERDSGRESCPASFTLQMDFGAESSFSRDQKINSTDTNASETGDKKPGKDTKSKVVPRKLFRNKLPEVRGKKPFSSKPAVQKSRQEREEETRRKVNELVVQRQKRIAERSAAAGLKTPAPKIRTGSGI